MNAEPQPTTALLPPVVSFEAMPSYVERALLLNAGDKRQLRFGPDGARWNAPDWSLPTGLNSFAARFGVLLGKPDGLHWLLHHTTAPYFQSTMRDEKLTAFQARLLEPLQGPRRPLLPKTVAEWFSVRPRLCADCDDEFVGCRGFSVVPRALLLPFVTRCPKHGVVLQECPAWGPVGRGRGVCLPVVQGREEAGKLFSLASMDLLTDQRTLLKEVGELLQSRGMTTSGGRVRRQVLAEALVRHAEGRYEHPELDTLLCDSARVARALTPLHSSKGCLHPAVALALAAALRSLPPVQASARVQASGRVAREILDLQIRNAKTATAAARAAGVSVNTVLQRADSLGTPFGRRPKTVSPELVQRILELASAGCSRLAISVAVGRSLSTVYRVCSRISEAEAEAKAISRAQATRRDIAAWKSLREKHSGATQKQLRALEPAMFWRLYRNAREVLLESSYAPRVRRALPMAALASSSRTPEGVDLALARRIEAVAATVAGTSSARLTAGALRSAAGRSNLHVVGPIANGRLIASVESKLDFASRRLDVAARQLSSRNEPLLPWRLIRQSNLRRETVWASGVDVAEVVRCVRRDIIREVASG